MNEVLGERSQNDQDGGEDAPLEVITEFVKMVTFMGSKQCYSEKKLSRTLTV